jgi:hypothetical protein
MAKKMGADDEDYYAKIELGKKKLKVCCAVRVAHVLDLSLFTILHVSGYECFTPPHLHSMPMIIPFCHKQFKIATVIFPTISLMLLRARN